MEICNPLAAQHGKNKLCIFYYTLANIDVQHRSRLGAIRTAMIVKVKYLKKYGFEKVMQPLLEDLHLLYLGYDFRINEVEMEIFGKTCFVLGDTEGQHDISGFKIGVGFAYRKCRCCMCSSEDIKNCFDENKLVLRTHNSYVEQCDRIHNASTADLKSYLSKQYGIRQRSALTAIEGFDLVMQTPQDIMHVLSEGVLQYEVTLVILTLLRKKCFTLCELNAQIENFEYGYSNIGDKPPPLRDTVFTTTGDKYKIKFSASQMNTFIRILPFLLDRLHCTNENVFDVLMQLIDITQICFSPFVTFEKVFFLKDAISNHLKSFTEQFPQENITPKQHYMLHFPRQILAAGPLIRQHCFRFEAKHNYFKSIARIQNFKNISLSIAERCQKLDCSELSDKSGETHPLFKLDLVFGPIKKLKENSDRWIMLKDKIEGLHTDREVVTMRWVIVNGTKYVAKQCFILVDADLITRLPIFAELQNIYVTDSNEVYFEYQCFNTVKLEKKFQAYHVERCEVDVEFDICNQKEIVDYNVYHTIKSSDELLYIPIKYDVSDITEHYLDTGECIGLL